MKEFICIFLALFLTSNVWADSKLSALSNNSSPTDTDLTYDVASGTSYNITLAQVKSYILTANVGIGTNNPAQALDVNGTVRASAFINIGGTSSQFQKADGSLDSSTYSTAVGANPTASVGLTAVNGSSTNFLRADGAPALSQTISPIWTGNHIFSPSSGNTLFTTGNVGIGTSLSANILDISSGVSIGTTYAGYKIAPANGLAISGNVGIGTFTASKQLTVGSTGQFTVDSTGNVGIGTSIVGPLFVYVPGNSAFINVESGNSTTAGGLRLDTDTGANFGILQINNSGTGNTTLNNIPNSILLNTPSTAGIVLDTSGLAPIIFGTGGSANSNERMRILSGGNIGIGSTIPSQKLDVNGTVRMTGFNLSTSPTNNYVLTSDASGNGTWQASSGGSGTINSGTTNRPAYYSGSTAISSGNGFYNGSNVGIGTALNTNLLDIAGGVTIGTTYAGYQIAPSNGLAIQGNVGIGTNIPNFLLSVGAAGNPSGAPTNDTMGIKGTANGSTSDFISFIDKNSGSLAEIEGISPNLFFTQSGFNNSTYGVIFALSSSGNTNAIIEGGQTKGQSTAPITFGTTAQQTTIAGGQIYMNGNVGIGSLTPGQALDIQGTLRILNNGNIQVGTTGYSDTGILGQLTSNTAGYNQLIVQNTSTASNASANYIVNNNLGSSSVYSEFGMNSSNFTGSGSFNQPSMTYLDAASGDLAIGTLASNAIHFVVNSGTTDAMVITAAGNVGINSASPGQTLDVQGTLRVFNNVGIGTSLPTQALTVNGGINTYGNTSNTYINSTGGNVGIGSVNPGQLFDVAGIGRFQNIIDTGVTANSLPYSNGSQQLASSTISTGLSLSSGTLSSTAVSFVTYQPGLLTAVNATIGVNYKFSKASTVDNIIGSAVTFSCVSNPTVTMYECGASTTCASPTTIGTVTVTAAGTLVSGTVSSPAITAGDFIGWAITAGTCASIDIAATAQVHSN